MKKNECRFKIENKGYALLTAVLAVAIFAVMVMKARTMWETEIRRELEQELIFRGRQYVIGIENFRKKNPNMFPQTLDELFEKKCIRKRFLDPMTKEGKWNVVMRSGQPGEDKNTLLVVPEAMAYAGIAGLPPQAGLYTLVASLLIYAWKCTPFKCWTYISNIRTAGLIGSSCAGCDNSSQRS